MGWCGKSQRPYLRLSILRKSCHPSPTLHITHLQEPISQYAEGIIISRCVFETLAFHSGKRILVVDDDEEFLLLVEDGLGVDPTRSLTVNQHYSAAQGPDLIILDLTCQSSINPLWLHKDSYRKQGTQRDKPRSIKPFPLIQLHSRWRRLCYRLKLWPLIDG